MYQSFEKKLANIRKKQFFLRFSKPHSGVLAQGSSSSIKKYGSSYIAASYIKYLESAGARVVPILVNQTDEYYGNIFKSLNG